MGLFVALGNEHNQINQTQQRLTWKYFNSPVTWWFIRSTAKLLVWTIIITLVGHLLKRHEAFVTIPIPCIYATSVVPVQCATILQSFLTMTPNTDETGKQSGAVMVEYFTHFFLLLKYELPLHLSTRRADEMEFRGARII